MSIYTKKGDKGETSTVDGQRVKKSDPWIDLYGEADELNSWIGVLLSSMDRGVFSDEYAELLAVQHRIFDLGSNLACVKGDRAKFKLPQIAASHVADLEHGIDRMTAKLIPLKHFVLPGGHHAAAEAHVCRTVCRRFERKMAGDLANLPPNSLEFINRLSDYLFTLSRYINLRSGHPEPLWMP